MIRTVATVALCAALAACGGNAGRPAPQVVTQTVEVPVPVRCNPVLGARPEQPDTDEALRAAGSDILVLSALLAAGRLIRIAWEAKQDAALNECRGSRQ